MWMFAAIALFTALIFMIGKYQRSQDEVRDLWNLVGDIDAKT